MNRTIVVLASVVALGAAGCGSNSSSSSKASSKSVNTPVKSALAPVTSAPKRTEVVLRPNESVFKQLDHLSGTQLFRVLQHMTSNQIMQVDQWLTDYAQVYPGLHSAEITNALTWIVASLAARGA